MASNRFGNNTQEHITKKKESIIPRNTKKSNTCAAVLFREYLQEKKVHTDFEKFDKKLADKGCSTPDQLSDVIQEVCAEVARRRGLGTESLRRRQIIQEKYSPIHNNIFRLQEEFLAPQFLEIVSFCRQNNATVGQLLEFLEPGPGEKIYCFPVFTDQFCKLLIEEINYFEGTSLPKGRPNTMNNYGVLLNELGFDDEFLTPLREHYIKPLTRLLYPEWGGESLDSHKAFVVKYKIDEDLDLAYHYDNAEVTLNVCLGKEFSGGQLYFGNMRTSIDHTISGDYDHELSVGVLHRGQHNHGARPITSGERYNLIIWMRSSNIRNLLCPMCDSEPNLVETLGFGDGFTKNQYIQEETVNVCVTL